MILVCSKMNPSQAALRHNNRSSKPRGHSLQANSGNTTTRVIIALSFDHPLSLLLAESSHRVKIHHDNKFMYNFQGDYPGNSQRRVGGLQNRLETRAQTSTRPSSALGNAPPFAIFVEKEFEDETRSSAASNGGGSSRGLQRVDTDFQVSSIQNAQIWLR